MIKVPEVVKENKVKVFVLVALVVVDWALFDSKYRKKLMTKIRELSGTAFEWVTGIFTDEASN